MLAVQPTESPMLTPRRRNWRFAAYIAFALLAIGISALHIEHFKGRPYRQDEAWIVHGALEKVGAADMTQWVSVNIHPPLWVILANVWVDVFGQNELVARLLSTLLTLVSLALLFRLGADLGGVEVGLAAVFLVGTSVFFQFYGHEFRPYPALITCTLGVMFGFMRWLRRPNFTYALLFVGFGIAGLYVHFFFVYVLAALAIFFVLFVRWDGRLYLRAFGLFFAVGLSYLGWLLPFLRAVLVEVPGGIDYAVPSTPGILPALYRSLTFQPDDIAKLLFIASLLIPMRAVARRGGVILPARRERFRFGSWWRKLYPLVVGVAILALAYTANTVVANLTQRSLVALMPLAALFLAFGLVALPRAAQVGVIVLLLPTAFTFVDYAYPGPQDQVAAYMATEYQPDTPVIMNVPYVPRQVALIYYIQNRMNVTVPNDLMWQVIYPDQAYIDFLPYTPVHPMTDLSRASLDDLRAFLDANGQAEVWYVENQGGNFYSEALRQLLAEHYTVVDQRSWEKEYSAVLYRRK